MSGYAYIQQARSYQSGWWGWSGYGLTTFCANYENYSWSYPVYGYKHLLLVYFGSLCHCAGKVQSFSCMWGNNYCFAAVPNMATTSTQQSIDQTLSNLPDVGEWLYHPSKDTDFLQREYGKTNTVKRSFQSQWCSKWQWLHYDVDKDVAYWWLL